MGSLKRFSSKIIKIINLQELLIGLLIILSVSMVASYVYNRINPFQELGIYVRQLVNLNFGEYMPSIRIMNQIYLPIFPDLLHFYLNSMALLLAALVLGITIGLTIAVLLFFIKRRLRKPILFFNYLLLSFPDFMLILVLQAIVIWVYIKTGVKLGNVIGRYDHPAILLPLISLSLFPMIYTVRMSVNAFQEVFSQKYILLAYSKGLNKAEIIFRHVLKNSLPAILANLPSIMQITISNMFIIEILYNVRGVMYFLYNSGRSIATILPALLIIWLSYFFINRIIQLFVVRFKGEGLDA